MVLVDATESRHGIVTLLVGVSKVEGKDGLVKKTLVKHVVEGRNNLVHGDGVITQAENAIEPAEGKGKTRLVGRLGEVLSLDLQVANLQGVLRNESAKAARAVLDGEFTAVLVIRTRGRRVILVVEVAGNRAAFARRNPKVRATSVQDNLELLGGSTQLDLREVYGRKGQQRSAI